MKTFEYISIQNKDEWLVKCNCAIRGKIVKEPAGFRFWPKGSKVGSTILHPTLWECKEEAEGKIGAVS